MARYQVFADARTPRFSSQRYWLSWLYAKLLCARAHDCYIEDARHDKLMAQWCQGMRLKQRPAVERYNVTLIDGSVFNVDAETPEAAALNVIYGGLRAVPLDVATRQPDQRYVKVHPDNIHSVQRAELVRQEQ